MILDIYVKPAKKATVAGRRVLRLKDAAEVVAPPEQQETVKNLELLQMTAAAKTNYLVSITDIIKTVQKAFPNAAVVNVGEMDTVIEFRPRKSKDNPLFKWLKILFVTLILLTGSATAIMSFHSDAQMAEVFDNYYKLLMGEDGKKPLLVDIPYAVGLAAGIIVFFNHLGGKKFTQDPTPIEVEMSQYETEVTDTEIDSLSHEKAKKEEAGQ